MLKIRDYTTSVELKILTSCIIIGDSKHGLSSVSLKVIKLYQVDLFLFSLDNSCQDNFSIISDNSFV